MVPPFDIFRVESDGHLAWRDTAETLELAKKRIETLMVNLPGEYIIYSQKTGYKMMVSRNRE